MDAQTIFDKASSHLIKQFRKATRESFGCAYRGQNGDMCAVGCLITEEEYTLEMEGKTVWRLTQRFKSMSWMIEHRILLEALQEVHDMHDTDEWLSMLRKVADTHGLHTHAMDKHTQLAIV